MKRSIPWVGLAAWAWSALAAAAGPDDVAKAEPIRLADDRVQVGLDPATGLWVWNRGRSPGVLEPAMVMQQHLQAPVAVLWHWWHDCAYDTGFPDYLPPREGTAACQAALESARGKGVHSLLSMNQRLWCTQTRSWTAEGAEAHAIKGSDGTIQPEVHNVFTKSPCAPMCIGTRFWRDTYASLAQAVVCDLKADGVYMDQTGCLADCRDPDHGHIVGQGAHPVLSGGVPRQHDRLRQLRRPGSSAV